jgi:hypothetical protein
LQLSEAPLISHLVLLSPLWVSHPLNRNFILYLAHLYQMAHQLKIYQQNGSVILTSCPLASLPSHYLRTSKSSWTQLWHASIPHPARTILWRLYHSKLPTRSRLHKIMPNAITDERCMLCGAMESDEHFFWSCPLKQPMWDTLSTLFLDQTTHLTFDEISRPHAISAIVRPHW